MTKLEKELASALRKVRKEHDLVKYAEAFYDVKDVSFQRLPLIDQFLPVIEKEQAIVPGEPFRWEGPVALDCPEFILLRPKSSGDVYILAPIDGPLGLEEEFPEEEIGLAMEMIPDDVFPFQVGEKVFGKDQMAFVYIPELEAILLKKPGFKKKLKLSGGAPIEIAFQSGGDPPVKLVACYAYTDGKVYLLAPIAE